MTDEQTIAAIAGGIAALILLTIIASVIGVIYITYVYRKVPDRRSIMFGMLVRADQVKVTAATWIGAMVIIRWLILDGAPLPLWTSILTAVAVEIILIPPVVHAITIWLLRNGYKPIDGSPPPWQAEHDPKEELDDGLQPRQGAEPAGPAGLADPLAPERPGADAGPAE